MSDEIFQELKNLNVATVVAIVVLVLFLFKILDPLYDKLKDYIISRYKKDVKEKSTEETLEDLTSRMKQYEDNRIHDREQSFRIQKELTDIINALNTRIDEMQQLQEKRYQESIDRENKRIRAELKDRISQSYRYYNEIKKWNYIERETLEDLIKEYEDAGGMNSFVHDKVVKEMYTWELIDCGYIPHRMLEHE